MDNMSMPVRGADVVIAELQVKGNPKSVVVDSLRVRGGGWAVQSIADRDAIPLKNRKERITVVYVADEDMKFELAGGITNEFWIEYKTGGEEKFTEDLLVVLEPGKYFGRYSNGDTIQANGKTPTEVIKMTVQEPKQPTASLTSPTAVSFNQTAINNVLNHSYVINSLGATADIVKLEFRRNTNLAWQVLHTDPNLTTYTHSITDAAYNTVPYYYQYTVIDTLGATRIVNLTITPQAYLAPTISFTANATALNGPQTNALREKGNISSILTGSANKNRNLVPWVSYQWQYRRTDFTAGNTVIGNWTNIGNPIAITTNPPAIALTTMTHNDPTLLSVDLTTLEYRVIVTDGFASTISSVISIAFLFLSKLGYNPTNGVLSSADAYALANSALLANKVRTVTGVTAPANNYTFILYPSGNSYGSLSNVIQNGATPVLGAFTQIAIALNVTNQYNLTWPYYLYKSNATEAFTNASLAIS